MGIQITNNATSLIQSAIGEADTSVTVITGDGSKYPTLAVGDYFYATLVDAAGNYEVVKATAKVDDTFTIVRAQESTTAKTFQANSRFEIRVTVANVSEYIASFDFLLL